MNKTSPLLMVFALLLIIASPIVLFYKLNERTFDLYYISDGVTTGSIIEAKLDTTSRNLEGKDLGFIMVSYHDENYSTGSTDLVESADSSYIDSVSALKRMLVAENFKQNIPGLKFVKVEVDKAVFDSLQVGESINIVYSAYHPEHVRLESLNIQTNTKKDNSIWITGCIIAFMVGIWLIVMNKRRRKQEQQIDPLSGMTTYSTIKKDQGPKTGGRPV